MDYCVEKVCKNKNEVIECLIKKEKNYKLFFFCYISENKVIRDDVLDSDIELFVRGELSVLVSYFGILSSNFKIALFEYLAIRDRLYMVCKKIVNMDDNILYWRIKCSFPFSINLVEINLLYKYYQYFGHIDVFHCAKLVGNVWRVMENYYMIDDRFTYKVVRKLVECGLVWDGYVGVLGGIYKNIYKIVNDKKKLLLFVSEPREYGGSFEIGELSNLADIRVGEEKSVITPNTLRVWHTHGVRNKPYPSFEDLSFIYRKKHKCVVSVIFTSVCIYIFTISRKVDRIEDKFVKGYLNKIYYNRDISFIRSQLGELSMDLNRIYDSDLKVTVIEWSELDIHWRIIV